MSHQKTTQSKRNKHLSILMTIKERELFKEAALSRGISTADLLRCAVHEKIRREGQQN